jgi:hypothetical protein
VHSREAAKSFSVAPAPSPPKPAGAGVPTPANSVLQRAAARAALDRAAPGTGFEAAEVLVAVAVSAITTPPHIFHSWFATQHKIIRALGGRTTHMSVKRSSTPIKVLAAARL